MTPFYRFATRGTIVPLFKMVSRQTANGLENVPREGGFIAIASHPTGPDSLTVMRVLVDVDVPVYSLVKFILFKMPALGSILRTGGQIPAQWGTQDTATALKAASEVLVDGDAIMIFPEGMLSRDPFKWSMVAKTRMARLAMTSDVLVLSMGQWGAHEILDIYRRPFHPSPHKNVRATIGELMDLSRFGQDTQNREAVRACAAEIVWIITALAEELRGGKTLRPLDIHYDGDPDKRKIGMRRPDLLPEADAREKDQ